MNMWIPKALYDHAPLFWLLLGGLFVAGAVYLGFDSGLRIVYYVLGIFCIGQALWTFVARRRYRSRLADDDDAADVTDT